MPLRAHILLPLAASLLPLVAAPTPDAGLYAIWYSQRNQHLLDLPFIVGGQVCVQWRDLNPAPGQFDFSPIDTLLRPLHERRYKTTIQINGNRKPDHLFDRVPHHPQPLSHQVRDPKGTLAFWHPVHTNAHLDLIRAFGTYLKTSPYRDTVLGIRLNFNALGTEHTHIKDPAIRKASAWLTPPDTKPAPDWTPEIARAYQKNIFEAYLQHIAPNARIFVRNGLQQEAAEPYRAEFENGRLHWFHTSSEAEPRGHSEWRYQRFYDDCRSGLTTAYAEPWASAWGDHGGKTDDRACSPPQWNYWRLLIDLHNGVSFIACYSSDLEVAHSGTYKYFGKSHAHDDATTGTNYKAEFLAAFQFASRYAGHHASPATSPGAWCAFRGNTVVREANGATPKARQLKTYTGDYDFLMRRRPDTTEALDVTGPPNQRFGAWARLLPANQSLTLDLDKKFATSLSNESARLTITYLGSKDPPPNFTVQIGDWKSTQTGHPTPRWHQLTLNLPKLTTPKITLTAHTPTTLHMVELERQLP